MEREILNGALEHGSECPDVSHLGTLVDGRLAPPESARIRAHVAECAACKAEITLIQAFQRGDVTDREAPIVRAIVSDLAKRPSPIPATAPTRVDGARWSALGTLRAVLSAAAALVAIVSGYYVFISRPPQVPTDIGAAREVTRALAVPLQSPAGDQRSMPVRMAWGAVAGASRYHVRLMDVTGGELWSTDTRATSVEIPSNVRARLSAPVTLRWDVAAYGEGGAAIGVPGTAEFRVGR